jgi:hypothetical protein
MKILKKIIKYFLLVIVVLVVIIIFPIMSYKQEINRTPLPKEYKKGVYHMHTVFSDGRGTIEDIARAAAPMDLDFIIVTDHGRPNRDASAATKFSNGVLVIGGSEFSLHSGHLACMGYKIPGYIFPPEPQEAIDEVSGDGGVCFISHPFDGKIPWTDWDIRGFTGIEVLSCYSSARKASFFKLASFPLQYFLSSDYALTSTLKYPVENIGKWNELNQRKNGCYYGIYALDAHAKLPISEKRHLNFPSYESMFKILRVYVKTGGPFETDAHGAARTVIGALRDGNFFNVIESIAPANGFEAFFLGASGNRVEMGGASEESKGMLSLRMPFGFKTTVIIKKDGKNWRRIESERERNPIAEVDEPGVYVIEVYARDNKFNRLPWILTNPFFLGVKETASSPISPASEDTGTSSMAQSMAVDLKFFIVETNPGSEGSIEYERTSPGNDEIKDVGNRLACSSSSAQSEIGERIISLKFKLSKDPASGRDFWSALAARKTFVFSGYTGIAFDARSDIKRRFWVEFRTGAGVNEIWYRHSFLVDTEWKRFRIPFESFHVIHGETKPPDLSDITSIFFSINNANAYEGTTGRIELKSIYSFAFDLTGRLKK